MTFDEWAQGVSESIKSDVLWKLRAYQLSLFLSDLAWRDATKLFKDRRTASIADQLYRAAGKISANICEGYSRGTGKDRAHFLEYAIGSTRESRDWYFKARHVLSESVANHRIDLCTEILKLTLGMIRNEREGKKRFGS